MNEPRFHSVYYPKNRAVPNKPSRLEEFCTWVGEPDPVSVPDNVVELHPDFLDVPAFLRRQAE